MTVYKIGISKRNQFNIRAKTIYANTETYRKLIKKNQYNQ